MSIAIGIIGAGNIGIIHAKAATRAGSRVVAVCDISPGKAALLAADYPGALATESVDELLGVENMTGIVVGVPNALHREVAIRGLRAGHDVLLEKPMAMSLAECDEIIAARDASGRLLQLGFICRFAPVAIEARRLIESGALGTILHAKAFMYRRRGIPGLGRWFTTKARSGGGVLIDLGVHLIDLVMHLTGVGDPLRVSASCTSTFGNPIKSYRYTEMWAGPPRENGIFDVDDAVTSLVRFEGGMTFELNVTWAANISKKTLPDGIVIMGDKGGLYLNLWDNRLILTTEVDGELADQEIPLSIEPESDAWDRAWRSEHEYFASSIVQRTAPAPSAEAGRKVQQVIEAMYRSSEAGKEVEI